MENQILNTFQTQILGALLEGYKPTNKEKRKSKHPLLEKDYTFNNLFHDLKCGRSSLSKQLKILVKNGLVKETPEEQKIHYTLTEKGYEKIRQSAYIELKKSLEYAEKIELAEKAIVAKTVALRVNNESVKEYMDHEVELFKPLADVCREIHRLRCKVLNKSDDTEGEMTVICGDYVGFIPMRYLEGVKPQDLFFYPFSIAHANIHK